MRWLRIAYALSRAGRPVVLSATLLSGYGSCGKLLPPPSRADGGSDAPGIRLDPLDAPPIRDTSIAVAQDTQVIVIPLEPYDAVRYSDARQVLGPAVDGAAGLYPECVDIDAGMDAGLTLPSGQTARVTMEWIDRGPEMITRTRGRITVAPEIAGLVVGLPAVGVIERSEFSAVPAIANLRPDEQTFVFDVNWTEDPTWSCLVGRDTHWVFRTTLRLQCGGQERAVESLTTVALCGGSRGGVTWASSGDACGKCYASVCEMAPSPLPAASHGDDLPLGSALGVVVRPVARVGGAVVLLAEHAPRPGLCHAWQATAGTLEQLAPDVVLWRLPGESGEPVLAQVAVTGDALATVASYRCDRRAA